MGSFTAKVKVTNRVLNTDTGDVTLSFMPDYAEGRNSDWAAKTPALSLSMTVKGDVGGEIDVNDCFTLTFVNDTAAEHDAAQTGAEASDGAVADEDTADGSAVL